MADPHADRETAQALKQKAEPRIARQALFGFMPHARRVPHNPGATS